MASLPTNYRWAIGFFDQACYDYFHGQAILGEPGWDHAKAMCLAQFQQAAEKAMKAAVFWERKKRLERTDFALMSHQIWRDEISKEAYLRGLKNSLLNATGVPEKKIKELENYAPHGTTNEPNTEYPWQCGRVFEVPAVYFSDPGMKGVLEQMVGIASAIVLHIKGCNRTFTTHFEVVGAHIRKGEAPAQVGRTFQ
jgi:hypothetical protein